MQIKQNIKNNTIYLDKLINFDFIKIIFDLNRAFFQEYERKDDVIYLVNNWLFKDTGTPQTAGYFHLEQTHEGNMIKIAGKSIQRESPYLLLEGDFEILFDITDKHDIEITIEIRAGFIPEFYEKMLKRFLIKIIDNVKQFIERMTM
jgi:hypothetical protein